MVSYRRIYENTIKRYAIDKGIVGISLIFLMFMLMVARDDITITGYSGDQKCAGTEYDPCYAYLNFTANTDIYVYPTDDMTWAFNVSPEHLMEKIVMQRSWGSSWRTINLSDTWTYKTKYSIKFNKGYNYSLRFIGYKKNINDTVKWGFGFDNGNPDKNTDSYVDPAWIGYNADDFFVQLLENEADLTYGHGVFKITNNLNKQIEISDDTISALFDINKGELLSYDYSVVETVKGKTVKRPKSICYEKEINVTTNMTNEFTGEVYFITKTKNDTVCEEFMRNFKTPEHTVNVPLKDKKIKLKKGESVILRIDGTYTPNSRIDWKPALTIDNVTFTQDKYAWWDSGWLKKKMIAINMTQNVTNYQFFVNLTYDSDMQPDGSDLRFVCYDNMLDTETQTSYWIESKSDGNYFNIHYNCSANTYNNSQSGVYYDNTSAATSLSNMTETFLWGDTAEVGAVGTLWTTITAGSGGTSGYNANYPKRGTNNLDVNLTGGGGGNYVWTYNYTGAVTGTSIINATFTYEYYDDGFATQMGMLDLGESARAADTTAGTITRFGPHAGVDANYYTFLDGDAWAWVNTTIFRTVGFHKFEVKIFNGNYTFFIDSTYVGTFINTTKEPKYLYFGGGGGGTGASKGYYDDIRVGNYIYPEPTSVIGAEEEPPVEYVTVTLNDPIDDNITSELTINFNATGIFDGTPLTCDLYTNESGWSLKHTNTTTIVNNTAFVISETFSSQGDYIWNIQCNDTDGNASFAPSNWEITIDTTSPSLYLIFPTNTTYINNPIAEISAFDNLDSCWYSINDGTNKTITDCGNGTMIGAVDGSNKLIIYINDTLGRENTSTAHFTKQEYAYHYIESFINTSQILSTENMSQRVHSGDKDGDIKINFTVGGNDSAAVAWATVILVDGVYKMWYSGRTDATCGSGGWSTFFANSTNNDDWFKPNLSFYGDNMVLKDLNAIDVMYDPLEGNVSRKYKMVFGYQDAPNYGGEIGVAFSEDGLTWYEGESNRVLTGGSELHETPSMVRNISDNTWIFPIKYWMVAVRYGKLYTAIDINGTWTDGQATISASSEFSQVHTYHLDVWGKYYYSFIDNYTSADNMNITLYFSDDAKSYTEMITILEISSGAGDWDNGWAGLSASRPLTVSADGSQWLNYYTGRNVSDDCSYRIGLATWRKGGIAGYNLTGTNETGTLTTRIVNKSDVTDDSMLVNVNASLGSLKIELIGNESTALTGYSESDFDIITTDVYNYTATWSGSSTLPNYDFKVKMYLNQSEMFEFWFIDGDDVGVDFTYIDAYVYNESANVAPTLDLKELYPANPYTTDNLTLNATCLDEDAGDTLTAVWTIYKDGANQTALHGSMIVTNGTETLIYTITSGNTSKGEVWIGEVYCDDATHSSSSANTTSRTILNTAPTTPDIAPTTNLNISIDYQEITCENSTDADSDTIYYTVYGDTGASPGTVLQNTTGTTYNWTSLSEGYNYFRCAATDGSDYSSNTSVYHVFVDTTLPDDIVFVSPTETNNSNLSHDYFYVNVTFTESNPDTCLLDSNGTNYTMTMVGTSYCYLNRTGQGEGTYDYLVYMNDTLGNINNSATYTLLLDTTQPKDIAFVSPTETDNDNKSQDYFYTNVTFTETYPDTCLLEVNSTNYTMNMIGDSYCYLNTTSLSDGTFTYIVYVNDTSGNINVSATRTLILDTTVPDDIVFVSPTETDNSNLSQDYFYVNVTFTEDRPDVCILDSNGTNYTMTRDGTNCYLNRTAQADGTYDYLVYVNDTAGNVNSSATYSLLLDTTLPTSIDYVSPTEIDNSNLSQDYFYINITFTEANPDTCILDNNGTNHTMTRDGTNCYLNQTGQAEGTYDYLVYVNDTAGNINNSATRTLLLDTTRPLIEFINPTASDGVNVSDTYTYINLSITEINEDTVRLNWNGTYQTLSNHYINKTGLSDGVYTYYALVNDTAGNSNITQERTITIDTTFPTDMTFVSPTETNNSNLSQTYFYVNITFTEANPDTCTLESNGTNYTMTVVGTSYCYINLTGQTEGTYDYLVYLNDSVGNINMTDTRTLLLDVTVPLIEFISPTDTDEDTVIRNYTYINLSITEIRQDTLILSWNGTNQTLSNHYINKTGLSDGNYTYYVWINDTVGNQNQTETRTVNIDAYRINLSFGPADTTLFRFSLCGPDFENSTVEPENQTAVYGIDYICNNGAFANDVQAKLSGALNTGWIWYASNTSITSYLITLNTSYQTIYSSLGVGTCIYVWHTANCSYVSQGPGVYEIYQILES